MSLSWASINHRNSAGKRKDDSELRQRLSLTMKLSQTVLLLSLASSYAFTILQSSSRPGLLLKIQQQEASAARYQARYQWALFASSEDEDEDDDEDDEDEDESDDGPLSKGVESVSWLPSVESGLVEQEKKDEAAVLPLFPLGGIVYTPNSEHILNIFEPRYREMYTDILMDGTKRFVVAMSHPNEAGRFASTGVLFELQDLKEVSEQVSFFPRKLCRPRCRRAITAMLCLHSFLLL
jgi:hypothetical protein